MLWTVDLLWFQSSLYETCIMYQLNIIDSVGHQVQHLSDRCYLGCVTLISLKCQRLYVYIYMYALMHTVLSRFYIYIYTYVLSNLSYLICWHESLTPPHSQSGFLEYPGNTFNGVPPKSRTCCSSLPSCGWMVPRSPVDVNPGGPKTIKWMVFWKRPLVL